MDELLFSQQNYTFCAEISRHLDGRENLSFVTTKMAFLSEQSTHKPRLSSFIP